MTEQMMPMFDPQCEVSQTSSSFNAFDIYLDEDIREPSYYRHALQVLRSAGRGDLVRIYVSTHGGNLNSALMIRNAIRECEADVIGIMEAEAYSAGGLIILSCPNIEVKPYSTMMCHSAAFGAGGIVQNVRDHVDFVGKHAEDLMDEVYKYFLSPDELIDLKRGRELWFDYIEVGNRLDAMFEARALEEEMEAEGCGNEECTECGEIDEGPSTIDEIIELAATKAVQKLLETHDIVQKPVAKAKTTGKKEVKDVISD